MQFSQKHFAHNLNKVVVVALLLALFLVLYFLLLLLLLLLHVVAIQFIFNLRACNAPTEAEKEVEECKEQDKQGSAPFIRHTTLSAKFARRPT